MRACACKTAGALLAADSTVPLPSRTLERTHVHRMRPAHATIPSERILKDHVHAHTIICWCRGKFNLSFFEDSLVLSNAKTELVVPSAAITAVAVGGLHQQGQQAGQRSTAWPH